MEKFEYGCVVRFVFYNIKVKVFSQIYPLFSLKGEMRVRPQPPTHTFTKVSDGHRKREGLRLFHDRCEAHSYEATVFGENFSFPSNLVCFRAKDLTLYLASCLPFHGHGQTGRYSSTQGALRRHPC